MLNNQKATLMDTYEDDASHLFLQNARRLSASQPHAASATAAEPLASTSTPVSISLTHIELV